VIVASQPASPDRMLYPERIRIRNAAHRAKRLYPGPVGELLFRELLMWEEFGYRFGGTALAEQLCDHVLRMPMPLNTNTTGE
jgi:hypothetical protein